MRNKTGFTLLELLLSLAVVAMVGLGVVFMLAGTRASAQLQDDGRMQVTRHQVAQARLGTLCRSNARILAVQSDHLVFWKGDVNANGKPDLAELRRLEWEPVSGQVWVSQAPADLPEGSNTTYELAADFSTLTGALAGTSVFPTQVVLEDIDHWELTLDHPAPASARLMRIDTRFAQSGPIIRMIASLRAQGG